MIDWGSRRDQMIMFGAGCIVLGTILAYDYAFVGIPVRFLPPLPPNPLAGLTIGIIGLSVGLVSIYYGLKQEIANDGTVSQAPIDSWGRDNPVPWGPEEEIHGNQVKVTVEQNGPYETRPFGSAWYKLGEEISLTAIPEANHPFKNWTCDTNLIEIRNPFSASTDAIVKGPGIITANFG
ncbi:MAG: hypothetical protein OK452_10035 [Thaumarchaeota archaeon]|nr:hypothetical protein [Nitrososphaerota archaeon]